MDRSEVNEDNVIGRTPVGTTVYTAQELDERRHNTAIIDYLCKLDEARAWIARHTGEETSLTVFLEELPKGEWLAKIAKSFDPSIKSEVHISRTREYMHTDNINMFLSWLSKIKLSRHFLFEVIDLYESKNIQNVIYCIHGLASFLFRRKMTAGIERRKTRDFTEEDKALVKDNIVESDVLRYEAIMDNLESEESEGRTLEHGNKQTGGVWDEHGKDKSVEHTEEEYGDAREKVAQFLETLLWQDAFDGLVRRGTVSVPMLRRFIGADGVDLSFERTAREIQRTQRDIIAKFKANYELQCEKESVLRSVRLLLENQARLRGTFISSSPLANDFRLFKRVLYALLHDYSLLFRIISSGSELPLRVFFPDNTIGDYHFSKFVEFLKGAYSSSEESMELISKIVRHHFMSSHLFSQLTELFNEGDKQIFELNPVDVARSLYSELPSVGERTEMLDDAIKDKNVRVEIVRRAALIIEYLRVRLDYLSNLSLPFYVRMFAGTSRFFEEFIEPAIMLSNNFVVSELVRYIFYSKDLFETETMAFEQERLYYYNCKYDRTQEFDFTDYSPLRDFLSSERNRQFATDFVSKNLPDGSVGEHFLSEVSDGKHLEVDICLSEINSLVLVLKQHVGLMNETMAKMVLRLSAGNIVLTDNGKSIIQTQNHNQSIPTKSGDEPSAQSVVGVRMDPAPVIVDGIPQDTPCGVMSQDTPCGASLSSHLPHLNLSPPVSSRLSSAKYYEERFRLQLDTHFIDLTDENVLALESMLRDLRARLILLIAVSREDNLNDVLHSTTDEERTRYADVDSTKKRVIDDLVFLSSKGIVSISDGFRSLLLMVSKDVIRCKFKQSCDEIAMNSETLDALYKKECLLSDEIRHLYVYTKDLLEQMTVNKSGTFFNRQAEPATRYGTYAYPLSRLRPVLFDNIDLPLATAFISMDEPLTFTLEVRCAAGLVSCIEKIGFDELLKLREDGITSFDFNGICALNVSELINIVNEQYIKE